MKKIIALIGPTASGKTALSLSIAKVFNCEIINMDAYQVYQELNIGTAKTSKAEQDNIPHHLIDIISVKDNYSIYQHQKLVREKIVEISKRNKIPLLVGGTGFYLKACIYDYEFEEEKEINLYNDYTNEELYDMLKEKDEKASSFLHPNNRLKVIRALNIANSTLNKTAREAKQQHKMIYDTLILAVNKEKEELNINIRNRVYKMFENGLEEEVLKLSEDENFFNYIASKAIGYKEFIPYFKKEITLEELKENIIIHTNQFRKRQMTWIRNQFQVKWVKDFKEAQEEIIEFLK
ncbi:MAG: tRNA (adenosine(37)-N6)-dimethylallyltransferase MiaA [Bacillales bacterium]|nr:tRNA (adenosine(37)-N6)-dimethylallyltransferase MiaA [Bacillales bacterium]